MTYTATIIDSNLHPMVEMVDSYLDITVEIPMSTGRITETIRTSGKIKDLSKIFEFKIESEHSWDLTGMTGRKCIISATTDGFEFVRFEED